MIKLIDVQKHGVSSLMSQRYLTSLFIASNGPSCLKYPGLELEFCSTVQVIFFHFLALGFCAPPSHFSFILFFFSYFPLILCNPLFVLLHIVSLCFILQNSSFSHSPLYLKLQFLYIFVHIMVIIV